MAVDPIPSADRDGAHHNVRPIWRPMSGSGALTISLSCALDDTRLQPADLRMLMAFGSYARTTDGLVRAHARTIATRLGLHRQAAYATITRLEGFGYVEIIRRTNDSTGRPLPAHHRLVLEYELPVEHRRCICPQGRAEQTCQSHIDRSERATCQSDVDLSISDDSTCQSHVDSPVNERLTLKRTTGVNDRGTNDRTAAAQPGAPRRTNSSAGGRLVDLLRAGGVPDALSPTERDFKALKSRPDATPEIVAECYLAMYRGEYGDDFMRKGLSIQAVIYRFLDGYLAQKAHPNPRQHTRGRPGTTEQGYRRDATLEEINATRHGYSGSRTGPIDPELFAIVERRFDGKR